MGHIWVLGAISWHHWSHLCTHRTCWVLGAISWHRLTCMGHDRTRGRLEKASTTETKARAMRDKGEALPMCTKARELLRLGACVQS